MAVGLGGDYDRGISCRERRAHEAADRFEQRYIIGVELNHVPVLIMLVPLRQRRA